MDGELRSDLAALAADSHPVDPEVAARVSGAPPAAAAEAVTDSRSPEGAPLGHDSKGTPWDAARFRVGADGAPVLTSDGRFRVKPGQSYPGRTPAPRVKRRTTSKLVDPTRAPVAPAAPAPDSSAEPQADPAAAAGGPSDDDVARFALFMTSTQEFLGRAIAGADGAFLKVELADGLCLDERTFCLESWADFGRWAGVVKLPPWLGPIVAVGFYAGRLAHSPTARENWAKVKAYQAARAAAKAQAQATTAAA